MAHFNFLETSIRGVYIIEPQVFGDDRGYFYETYQKDVFDKAGLVYDFVQANESKSHKGVLRGLHFQTRKPQAKLVRVTLGEVYDVAVDLRKDSPTYGKYVGVLLSEENHRMFMIPRGFAHGFVVLSDIAKFEYQVDDVYDPGYEGGIMWNDPEIGIKWPYDGDLDLSVKDKLHPALKDAKIEFGMKEGRLQVL
jgi:dTDP-4-dehydrorhamnose 3,5-epimerase